MSHKWSPTFARFASLDDAIQFAREHSGSCRHPGEEDSEPSYRRSAASLLALQEGIDAGRFRVVVQYDDDLDVSWDDIGEVAKRLDSGEYVGVGVTLERLDTWTNERTGERLAEWEPVDSLWGIIGPDGDPYWQAVAADMFPTD